MKKPMRALWLLAIGLALSGCDQITKSIAQNELEYGVVHSFLGDTVRLQLAHNYGAFLSLGASLPEHWRHGLWSVGVGIVVIGMLFYALFARAIDKPTLASLALIAAGGASNLYDRLAYGGYVIDFLNVGLGPVRTGIFNVADMGIMAGAFVMLWTTVRGGKGHAN